jgi:hypothetical protein
MRTAAASHLGTLESEIARMDRSVVKGTGLTPTNKFGMSPVDPSDALVDTATKAEALKAKLAQIEASLTYSLGNKKHSDSVSMFGYNFRGAWFASGRQ